MGAVTLWALAASAAAQDPAPADRSAQPAADNPETIIVTGERAKRTLKDTPSSVIVFDKRDMERLAAPDRLQQLLELVPNVLVPTSRDTPVIRGQSGVGVLAALPAFLGGARPRTVMQIDGRTVTFNEFVNSAEGLWDVDHVEVFRSPQTTTQGVNSIAGAIFIHTADPSFDYEGQARVIAGQSSRRQASALVSGPLVRDQLAFRLSADVYQAYSSTSMHGPVVGARDLNIDHYWTVRAKLLAQPSAVPGLKLLTTYAHTHSQAPQAELAQSPFGKRRDDNYVFGYFKSDVDSVTGTITYPLADGLESRTTLSAGRSHFQRFAPQGFGQTQIHARDESAETVLDWKPAGRVSAIGGISFQQVKLGQFINLARANLGVGSFDDRQRSAGVFGELTWLPAERLSVTAGARYQSDSKKRVGVLRMLPPLPLDYDKSTHAFLPKVSIGYDLSSNWRVGLLVQRAYNPGGVTLDPAHRAQLEFKPEYLWDYEAFTRASLMDGLVSVTGNLFYNAMRDAQRELDFDLNSPGGQVGLLQIVSEPRARTYGAELEVSAKATQWLTMTAAIGLLSTRITKATAPNDPFLGKEFGGAPHFTGVAAADWQPVRSVHLSAQARRTSGFWGDDAEDPMRRVSGWTIVDAKARWQRGALSVFAYAQNLLDKFHVVSWARPRNDPAVDATLTEPRELGVGVEGRF
jgi:outer membrane receptor protein involved in Fe transport